MWKYEENVTSDSTHDPNFPYTFLDIKDCAEILCLGKKNIGAHWTCTHNLKNLASEKKISHLAQTWAGVLMVQVCEQ